MKKAYLKPEIIFEDFTLNENIAGNNCEVRINNQTLNVCGFPHGTGGETLFVDELDACSFKVDDDINNGFCYHIPMDTANLFNS